MMELIVQLKAKQDEAKALQAKEGVTVDEVVAARLEIETIQAKIDTQELLDKGKKFDENGDEERDMEPVNKPMYAQPADHAAPRLFKDFGDQLKAVKNVTRGIFDERLNQINNASGMSEGVPSEGGFAIQTDFAGAMMESAANAGNILPLVDRYEVGAGSNGVKWVDIDESSVATTVFGGVQVYWAGEAAKVTATKPKLMEKSLDLKKLMGIAYATYELEQDTTFTSDLYSRAFSLAIQRKLEGEAISGDGAAGMLGMLKSGALVSVAAESGQGADTVIWENISKMYNRSLNKTGSVWLMHPDVAEQLDFLSFPVGTGGVPVYLPAAQAGSVSSLRGRPIIESDGCSALGDVGDIMFVDLKEYMLLTKGGVIADTSMHVEFLAAENCFRFIFRVNGMPKRNQKLTIKNSSNQRSSYVALAAR
jgi:HK97 family phage major capsid protein